MTGHGAALADDLRHRVRGRVLGPDDPEFQRASQGWNLAVAQHRRPWSRWPAPPTWPQPSSSRALRGLPCRLRRPDTARRLLWMAQS